MPKKDSPKSYLSEADAMREKLKAPIKNFTLSPLTPPDIIPVDELTLWYDDIEQQERNAA